MIAFVTPQQPPACLWSLRPTLLSRPGPWCGEARLQAGEEVFCAAQQGGHCRRGSPSRRAARDGRALLRARSEWSYLARHREIAGCSRFCSRHDIEAAAVPCGTCPGRDQRTVRGLGRVLGSAVITADPHACNSRCHIHASRTPGMTTSRSPIGLRGLECGPFLRTAAGDAGSGYVFESRRAARGAVPRRPGQFRQAPSDRIRPSSGCALYRRAASMRPNRRQVDGCAYDG
jgi:hypothetical protein